MGHAPPDDQISLLDCLRAINRHKVLVIASVLIAAIAFLAVGLLTQPVYRSEALLMPSRSDQQGGLAGMGGTLGGLTSLVGLDFSGDDGRTVEAVATLKSQSFTRDFIVSQNLMPILFADDWDAENERWRAEREEDIPSLHDAYRRFDDIRDVTEDGGTGLVTLSIEWTDPQLAAEWVNLLVERVNQRLRSRAIEQAENSLVYLKRELGKTNVVELQRAIYSLIEGSVNEVMLANVTDEFAFEIIDPAIAADEDDPVRPQVFLMLVIGALLGLFFGVAAALVRYFVAQDDSVRQ